MGTPPQEKARIAARADRFKGTAGVRDGDAEATAAVAASAAAAAELQEREAEFAREKAAMEARAAKFGLVRCVCAVRICLRALLHAAFVILFRQVRAGEMRVCV